MYDMDYPNRLIDLIEKPTLFITGAGASAPYSFPLGNQLKNEIFASLQSRLSPILVKNFNYDPEFIEEFKDSLKYTSHPTIDIFLEHKKQFREIGSYAIAYTILKKENHQVLFPQKNWYGTLYNMLNLNNPKFKLSNLSIATLNYERSLEYFLKMNIKYNCREEFEKKAIESVEKIKIIHAHGSLGNLDKVPFGKKFDVPEILKLASQSIKIVSDKLEDSVLFKNAQTLITESNNIIIMGIGYDLQTLGKLFANIDLSGKTILGTTKGITKEKEKEIISFFNNNITLDEFNSDCDVFLNSKFRKI